MFIYRILFAVLTMMLMPKMLFAIEVSSSIGSQQLQLIAHRAGKTMHRKIPHLQLMKR